jgi:hypothetical protein
MVLWARLTMVVSDFMACSLIGSAMSFAAGLADFPDFVGLPSTSCDQVLFQFSIASGVHGTATTATRFCIESILSIMFWPAKMAISTDGLDTHFKVFNVPSASGRR